MMNSCSVLGLVFMSAPFAPTSPLQGEGSCIAACRSPGTLSGDPMGPDLCTTLVRPVSSGALHYSVRIHHGQPVPALSPGAGGFGGLVPVGRLALPMPAKSGYWIR